MEHSAGKVKLSLLPTGTRLLFRSRNEWRAAAIAGFDGEKASIHIASPRGRTYRIYRSVDSLLTFDGRFYRLTAENSAPVNAQLASYDRRW